MRIARLEIENFRSVQRLELDLPQMAAFVGPNSAGKSNILLALRKVLGHDWVSLSSFSEADVYQADPNANVRIAVTLEPPIAYTKLSGVDPVEIHSLSFEFCRYKKGAKKGDRRFEAKCLGAKGQAIHVLAKHPKKGEQRQYEPLLTIPQEVREAVPVVYIGTDRSVKDQLPSSRGSLLRRLLEDIERDLASPAETTAVGPAGGSGEAIPRGERFRQLMDETMQVLRTTSFASLEQSIRRNIMAQLGLDPKDDASGLDFHFAPFSPMDFYKALDLRVREGDIEVSATELGDGIQNALVLAILRVYEERRRQGAVLLIEEPEMFLHPQMQRSLYRSIRQIAETNQVLYTTHSPHFVSVPEYFNTLLVRKSGDATTVARSGLKSDLRLQERLVKELDPERNELFFATRLLIVEGDTEKLALPAYASRLGLDLDQKGVTVVEVGGKRNLRVFADIATSFGIPTGIIYDQDSAEFRSNREAEALFNEELENYCRNNGHARSWCLTGNYETCLRDAVGAQRYQALCQEYPNVGKPTRARLIALHSGTPIPAPIEEALRWACAQPSETHA